MADRLLVIDDEPELGRFVGRVGESMGFETKVTARALEFKDLVNSWKPSAIILDLAMPDADGLELLRWLASENCRAHVAIMSGFDARVVEAAKRIGQERGLDISFTFNKPIRMQELKDKLQTLKQTKGDPITESDLQRCFDEHQLFVVYQPKVSFQTGAVQGVEALVRWRHPDRGIIPPDVFVSLAEQCGLISRLTGYVMSEAVFQHKFWAQQGLDLQFAVNLSPLNLREDHLADKIGMLCQTESVPANRITIEVTESVAMSQALESLDVLTRLRLKGFKLSIDDFGTGFSSLARLRSMPLTEIKIDKSFVNDALSSQDAFIIVKSIIGLAHNMNMACVAEGVETDEHYQLLAELGCDFGQGMGISKPLEANALQTWHTRWKAPNFAIGHG